MGDTLGGFRQAGYCKHTVVIAGTFSSVIVRSEAAKQSQKELSPLPRRVSEGTKVRVNPILQTWHKQAPLTSGLLIND